MDVVILVFVIRRQEHYRRGEYCVEREVYDAGDRCQAGQGGCKQVGADVHGQIPTGMTEW